MSPCFLTREYRLRRAFRRWGAGVEPPGREVLEPLAGRDPAARWVLGVWQAEQGESGEGLATLAGAAAPFRAVALIWAGRAGEATPLLEPPAGPLEESLLGLAALEEGDAAAARAHWRRSSPLTWRLAGPRSFALLLAEARRLEPEALQKRLAEDLGPEPAPPPLLPAALFRRLLDGLEMALPALRGDRERLEQIRILSLRARGRGGAAIKRAAAARRQFREADWPGELLLDLLAQAGEDRRLLDVAPEGPETAELRGVALARLDRWEEAAAVVGGEPSSILPLYVAACAAAFAGERDRSARLLIRLLDLDAVAFHEVAGRELARWLAREA